MKEAVGVDIGGTKILAALITEDGDVESTHSTPTPERPEEAVAAILETIEKAWSSSQSRERPAAIGIGAAGLVDFDAGVVRYAPNLSYREVPLRELVGAEFSTTVVLDNDATCAGLAEYRIGAGRGSQVMVMVTVGTGIGGGFIFNGQIFRGRYGFAAEIGHMTIDPKGPLCGCGERGCWERMSSGTALGEMARKLAATPEGQAILDAAGGEASAVRGEAVADAAASGDPAAINLLARLGTNLGVGLANLANILDPDRFVIGGGLSRIEEHFLAPARVTLAERMEGASHRPPIEVEHARLGNLAGVVGAALMALDEAERA